MTFFAVVSMIIEFNREFYMKSLILGRNLPFKPRREQGDQRRECRGTGTEIVIKTAHYVFTLRDIVERAPKRIRHRLLARDQRCGPTIAIRRNRIALLCAQTRPAGILEQDAQAGNAVKPRF